MSNNDLGFVMDRGEWIIVAACAALAVRVAVHFIDQNRIRGDVEAKGGKIVSITCNPFGRGWLFERTSVIMPFQRYDAKSQSPAHLSTNPLKMRKS